MLAEKTLQTQINSTWLHLPVGKFNHYSQSSPLTQFTKIIFLCLLNNQYSSIKRILTHTWCYLSEFSPFY